jgi:hypothetical protein
MLQLDFNMFESTLQDYDTASLLGMIKDCTDFDRLQEKDDQMNQQLVGKKKKSW